MPDWNEIASLLDAKLDAKHVKPPAKFGPKGSYIEGWHAIAEANRIFGFGGWSYDVAECRCVSELPREIGQAKKPGFGVSYIARVVVCVGDVRRDDVGAGHGYDVDCGLAHESAIKEAVTDALKRSLRTFGNPFGLALYDKTQENVETAPKLSEQAKAPAPRQSGQANTTPTESAIAWLKASSGQEECAARWAKLQATKPEVAADSAVIAAYNETFNRFTERWPGDAVQRPLEDVPF